MKSTVRVSAAFALTSLCLTLLAIATPGQAAPARSQPQPTTASAGTGDPGRARGCRPPTCYGAISMSPDRAYGWANEQPRRRGAVQKAHRRCKAESAYPGYCRRMGSIGNGCMAVAIRTNSDGWITRWKTGYGRTLRQARRQAHRRINGGTIRASLCTSRRY